MLYQTDGKWVNEVHFFLERVVFHCKVNLSEGHGTKLSWRALAWTILVQQLWQEYPICRKVRGVPDRPRIDEAENGGFSGCGLVAPFGEHWSAYLLGFQGCNPVIMVMRQYLSDKMCFAYLGSSFFKTAEPAHWKAVPGSKQIRLKFQLGQKYTDGCSHRNLLGTLLI